MILYLFLQLLTIAALGLIAVLLLARMPHDSTERRPFILRSLPNELEPEYAERQWRKTK